MGFGYGNYSYPYFNYGIPQNIGFPNYGGYNLAFQASPWGGSTASKPNTSVSDELSKTESAPTTSAPALQETPKTKVCIDIEDGIIRTNDDKNVAIVETTPEIAEEFKKKCKNDKIFRKVAAIGTMLAVAGLAAWLGPKGAKKIAEKSSKPWVQDWIGVLGDGTTESRIVCGLWGAFSAGIPAAFYSDSTSTKKALAKEYFPEAYKEV